MDLGRILVGPETACSARLLKLMLAFLRTILASMSGFFTLGLGRLFRVESFTSSKLIAVSIS